MKLESLEGSDSMMRMFCVPSRIGRHKSAGVTGILDVVGKLAEGIFL